LASHFLKHQLGEDGGEQLNWKFNAFLNSIHVGYTNIIEDVGLILKRRFPIVPFGFSAKCNGHIGWTHQAVENIVQDLVQNCATGGDDGRVCEHYAFTVGFPY